MTSTCEQDICACGCGQVILPTDDHPWFKRAACQKVWMFTASMTEAERVQWLWDQRFYFTLCAVAPWGGAMDWEFEYTDENVISSANSRLDMARIDLEPLDFDDPDSLVDALRILTHWHWVSRTDPHAWMAEDLLPPWVLRERRRRKRPRRVEMVMVDTLRQLGLRTDQEVQDASVGPI